jgi:hypothetical protein
MNFKLEINHLFLGIVKKSISIVLIGLFLSSFAIAQREHEHEHTGPRGEDPVGRPPNPPNPPSRAPQPPARPLTPQPPTTTGVRIFGDWPPVGHCDFTLYPSHDRQNIPDPGYCNDTTSGVDVPFGMSVEVCENGVGDPHGLGKCRRFLPGMNNVGDDLNDKASSFLVDNKMVGYMNSADYPTGIKIGINFSGSDFNNLSPGGSIGYDEGWFYQNSVIPLPSSCPNPHIVELTKAGDASWYSKVENNQLKLNLRVKNKSLFGANNWVGVEIVCQ